MDELVIKTHDFEKSKNELKKFSDQVTTDLDLKKVGTQKDAGEFWACLFSGEGIGKDHKVSGAELNELTGQIQKNLRCINNTQRSLIKEFGEVYNTFEALDKDYIPEILIAIKSSQKANNETKIAQEDIEKTIENQKKIIKVLQQFKERLDKYQHLSDIDKIWRKFQTFQEYVLANQKAIDSLEQFRYQMNSYRHLSDIDKMWINVAEDNKKISLLSEQIDGLVTKTTEQANSLSKNKEIVTKLSSQNHIYEVDRIWQDSFENKKNLENITTQVKQNMDLIEKQTKLFDELFAKVNQFDDITHLSDVDCMFEESISLKNKVETLSADKLVLEEKIADLNRRLDEEHNKSEEMKHRTLNKIKMSLLLAGGSVVLSVVVFLLAILGLI